MENGYQTSAFLRFPTLSCGFLALSGGFLALSVGLLAAFWRRAGGFLAAFLEKPSGD